MPQRDEPYMGMSERMNQLQEDQTWEREMAKRLQAVKAALTQHLGIGGRAGPGVDLVDHAKKAIEVTPNRADKVTLGKLMDEYVTCVNRLWLYAENVGLTGKLTSAWMRHNRRNLSGVDRADYSAEATFAMRQAVTNFTGAGPLVSFAFMYVNAALVKLRDSAGEFARLPEGSNPTPNKTPFALIDDVTPETVLVVKRHLAEMASKEGA